MRQVVLDTETTGIGHEFGHRIIEIGCVELVDRQLTGQHYHIYINPEREVDEGAFKVHGISTEFLKDKPLFSSVLNEFVNFIDGAELIIHNAPFDVGFLNAEFSRAKWSQKIEDHCSVIDTLVLAKEKHPGQRNNLDALCKRYDIDNKHRHLHGALLDAEILAGVYLAMTGGQTSLFASGFSEQQNHLSQGGEHQPLKNTSGICYATADELKAHQEFIEMLQKKSGKNYWA